MELFQKAVEMTSDVYFEVAVTLSTLLQMSIQLRKRLIIPFLIHCQDVCVWTLY